jgi:hypothetical protein
LVNPGGQQGGGRRQVGQAGQGGNVGIQGVEAVFLRSPGGFLRVPPLALKGVKLRG